MSVSSTRNWRTDSIVLWAVMALLVALVVFDRLDVPIGPGSETTGIVQGSAFVPADGPPPSKNIWVRLPDGAVAVINVRTDLQVVSGQEVRVRVNRRLITNVSSYSIVTSETAK